MLEWILLHGQTGVALVLAIAVLVACLAWAVNTIVSQCGRLMEQARRLDAMISDHRTEISQMSEKLISQADLKAQYDQLQNIVKRAAKP